MLMRPHAARLVDRYSERKEHDGRGRAAMTMPRPQLDPWGRPDEAKAFEDESTVTLRMADTPQTCRSRLYW